MGKIGNEELPLGFTTISLDVKSLFTFVLLTETIGSTLGPIVRNLFLVKFENTVVPRLHQHVKN